MAYLLSLFYLLFSFAAIADDHIEFKYQVAVDTEAFKMDVIVCSATGLPDSLVMGESALLYVSNLRTQSGDSLGAAQQKLTIADPNAGNCFLYDVHLRPKRRGEQRGGTETRLIDEANLLTSIEDWLVRPSPDVKARLNVQFISSDGIHISTPWERVTDNEFIVSKEFSNHEGIVAFSRYPIKTFKVGGCNVELTFMSGFTEVSQEDMSSWVRQAAQGVSRLIGRFPLSRVQVVISASDRGSDTVPWAYVTRGGGGGVHLLVQRSVTKEQLDWDWSLSHELSHFLLPDIDTGDYWLIEGLPTYLQHLSMVRGDLITSDEAWRRLRQGFIEGSRTGGDISVFDAMSRMTQRGMYRKIYWGGAAFFFGIDARLRQSKVHLDGILGVLSAYHDCCFNFYSKIAGPDLIQQFDSLSRSDVFSKAVRSDIHDVMFPDFEKIFESLGLEFFGRNLIVVDEDRATISRDIMRSVK